MQSYRITRDISQSECFWLDKPRSEGEIVYSYSGYTYGCISPDGIACTEKPGVEPFLELPRAALSEVEDA